MNKLAKQITVFVVLGIGIAYLFFVYVRQNERIASCTRLHSQCLVTDINYLMLGGIDIRYTYWIDGKTTNVRWKESDTKLKELIKQIKVGDTLPLLYCKEYPNLNTPVVNGKYLHPLGW
jgi:hypothetical protein